MKTLACALLAVMSFSSLAQSLDQTIGAKIERLSRASAQGTIARLSRMEKDELNNLMDRALQVVRDDGRDGLPDDYRPGTGGWIPGGGYGPGSNGPGPIDWRRNSSWERNQVVAYRDDNCTSSIIEVRAHDSCERLTSIYRGERLWSVAVNGQCVNIQDTTFANKCESLKTLALSQKVRTNDLELFTDDNCSGSAKFLDLDPGVDCSALGGVYTGIRIWSIKAAGGVCLNVQDTTFSAPRCEGYQTGILGMYESDGSRRRGDSVELFTDDHCMAPLTNVKRGDNCQALNNIYGGMRVWSIRHRGQCLNIQDTNYQNACQTYAQ